MRRKKSVIQPKFIFNLGDEVEDVVTGFTGTVVARFQYLTGCNHYQVEAKATKDSKTPYENLDEQRLKLVKEDALKLPNPYPDAPAPSVAEPAARTSPGRAPTRGGVR